MNYRFEKLIVWQKAINLALEIYQTSQSFPAAEINGLTQQIRKSATAIGTYIAQGCAGQSSDEMSKYLQLALKYAYEVMSLIILANKLDYIGDDRSEELKKNGSEVIKLIITMINCLKNQTKINNY